VSTFNDLDMTCEQCGEEFRGTVWTGVHVGVDPELKELLLGGELNMVMCPKCSHVAYHEHFLIYQEPTDELIAYVYPENQEEQRDELTQMMKKGFLEAQDVFPPDQRVSYEPIILFGLEALVEILHEEIDFIEQSDVAEAICKEKDIGYAKIRPSESRQRRVPRILPRTGTAKRPDRVSVIAGLKQLIAENSLLSAYVECLKMIEADPAWSL